jgi:plasmid maintenance system antidote protein VapI
MHKNRDHPITADTALRLARHFGGTTEDAQGWLNMQATYDLKTGYKASGKTIAEEVLPRVAHA